MKYIKLSDEDLMKSVIEVAAEHNVHMGIICVMALFQKTWIRCRELRIHHPAFGSEAWLREMSMMAYPGS